MSDLVGTPPRYVIIDAWIRARTPPPLNLGTRIMLHFNRLQQILIACGALLAVAGIAVGATTHDGRIVACIGLWIVAGKLIIGTIAAGNVERVDDRVSDLMNDTTAKIDVLMASTTAQIDAMLEQHRKDMEAIMRVNYLQLDAIERLAKTASKN